MKFLRILVLLAITIAFVSCGTKKTTAKETVKEVTENANSVVEEVLFLQKEAFKLKFAARKTKMTEEEVNKWPHMDIYTDSVPGISLAKAYKFIANKTGKR